MAQSPGDFAVQDRIARLADLMAEKEDGKAALQVLAEDDRVVLSLLVDCAGETRGQALGAAAIKVMKILPWEGLTGWFGEDMLARRIGEVLTTVNDGIEISGEQRVALDLAVDYASGNRPQTPWERLARPSVSGSGGNRYWWNLRARRDRQTVTMTSSDMQDTRAGRRAARADGPRSSQPKRRTFTAAYKLAMIEKYDAATEPGAKGALLCGEGLYDSHISYWRKARNSGSLASMIQG